MESRADLSIKERVFVDDFPGMLIYLDRYNREQHLMSGILIHDERNPSDTSTVFAESGVIATDPATKILRLKLKNGSIHHPLGKTGYRLIEFADYDLSINLQESVREIVRNELDMSLAELRQGIGSASVGRKMRLDMSLELHRRFALPFACFIFVLVGMPLGIQHQRTGKGAGFSLSIGVLLIYYIVLSAGKALGERNLLHPAAAVWTPNLLFLVLGLYLFRKTAREERFFLFEMTTSCTRWLQKLFQLRRES
jgi:lipopolysaccharide export system permease protein